MIGSTGHAYVTCVTWADIGSVNIVDFDLVVVNMRPLTESFLKARVFNFFDPIRKSLSRLLRSRGTIVAIGTEKIHVKQDTHWPQDSYSWSPIDVETRRESGDTITLKGGLFPKYLSHLKEWKYWSVFPYQCLRRELTDVCGDTRDTQYDRKSDILAENRENRMLAGSIQYTAKNKDTEKILTLGPLVILPHVEELEEREAVNLVLEDLLSLPQKALPPEWVAGVPMPRVPQILASIAEHKKAIQKKQAEIAALENTKDELESYKKLLYSTGRELEQAFERCLKALGGSVSPAKYSQEEFVLTYKGEVFLVECKGVGKSVALGHVRQLTDYMLKYEEDEGVAGKGVLFSNAWKDLPLESRDKAKTPLFPSNVVTRAAALSIALVPSQSFFAVFCQFLDGKVTGDAVLDRITSTVGVVDFAGLESPQNELQTK